MGYFSYKWSILISLEFGESDQMKKIRKIDRIYARRLFRKTKNTVWIGVNDDGEYRIKTLPYS